MPFPHNKNIVNLKGHNSIRLQLFVIASLLLLAPGMAVGRGKSVSVKPNADYVSALATADRFMHAWQTQDEEKGLMMLTDSVKQHWPEERLEAFFASADHAAYQISQGRKLKAGRYSFPVALLENVGTKIRRRFSEVVVTQTGREDWAVDKLP